MSLKKVNVQTNAQGFKVDPAPEYVAKLAREKKAADLLAADPSKVTLAEVFQLLQVVAGRQAEIYDMLKEAQNK